MLGQPKRSSLLATFALAAASLLIPKINQAQTTLIQTASQAAWAQADISQPAKTSCVIVADLNQTSETSPGGQTYRNLDDPLSLGCAFGRHFVLDAAFHDMNDPPNFDAYFASLQNNGGANATLNAPNSGSGTTTPSSGLPPPPEPSHTVLGRTERYFLTGLTVTYVERPNATSHLALTLGELNINQNAGAVGTVATNFKPLGRSPIFSDESYSSSVYGLLGGTASYTHKIGNVSLQGDITAGNEPGRGANGPTFGGTWTMGAGQCFTGATFFQRAPGSSEGRETRRGGFAECSGTIAHHMRWQANAEVFDIKNRIAYNPGDQQSWTSAILLERDIKKGFTISAMGIAAGNNGGGGVSTGYSQNYSGHYAGGQVGLGFQGKNTSISVAGGIQAPFRNRSTTPSVSGTNGMPPNPQTLIESGLYRNEKGVRVDIRRTLDIGKTLHALRFK